MDVTASRATDPAILAEQVAYYRKRAGEYDEWWFRTGRYDRGEELNAAWNADVAEVESALCAWLDARRPRRALELACGTGLFTRWVAPRVGTLLALDASPEVQAINRARVGGGNVEYAVADLFAWEPAARYDLVFMSFWLSHVPDDRFDAFWAKVRASLADGGSAYVIDSGWDMTSTAKDHVRPDREGGVAERKLNDGSEYRIVKIFHDPGALAQRLGALGFVSNIVHTPRYFIHGPVGPR
ncbi:MAG TPA: methyltransferase domain-containing protein [Casimicrobiaceae bacterium]|nr:methyltransferase domain-containing protein [Casimicrobiaceae bacterium]